MSYQSDAEALTARANEYREQILKAQEKARNTGTRLIEKIDDARSVTLSIKDETKSLNTTQRLQRAGVKDAEVVRKSLLRYGEVGLYHIDEAMKKTTESIREMEAHLLMALEFDKYIVDVLSPDTDTSVQTGPSAQ